MKRPAAAIGFTALATLIFCNAVASNSILLLCLPCAALFCVVAIVLKTFKNKRTDVFIASFATILVSVLLFLGYKAYFVGGNAAVSGKEVTMQATLVKVPQTTDSGMMRYKVRPDKSNIPLSGYTYLYSRSDLGAQVYDKITCTFTAAEMPAGVKLSGYENSYRAENVYITGFIDADAATVTHSSEYFNPFYYAAKLNEYVENSLRRYTAEDTSGLAVAITTGNKTQLPQGVYEDFKVSGLTHTMATSGQHLAILMVIVTLLCGLLGFGDKGKYIIGAIIAVCFSAMVGFSPAITRALIMALVTFSGMLRGTDSDSLNSLGFATIIICALNPFAAVSASFLLSFSATLGLVVLMPQLVYYVEKIKIKSKIFNNVIKFILYSTVATVSATLFTLPVSAYFFGYTSAVCIPANLLANLPVAGVLMFGLFSVATSWFGAVASLFGFLCTLCCRVLIQITSYIGNLKGIMLYVDYWFVYIIIALMILIFILRKVSHAGRKISLFPVLCVGFVAVLVSCTAYSIIPKNNNFFVTMIDVGQGDSFIVGEKNDAVLIDGGTKESGENIVSLVKRDNLSVKAILVTHDHSDHIGGLPQVIEDLYPRDIVLADVKTQTTLGNKLRATAAANNMNIIKVSEDRTLSYLENTTMEFLVSHIKDDGNENDLNKLSALVTAENGGKRFLFMGDYDYELKELTSIYGDKLKCSVLKVAHHGSLGAADNEFLQFLGVKHALISVGKDNSYNLPNQKTIEYLKNNNINVYRTDQSGNVIITTDGQQLVIQKEAA